MSAQSLPRAVTDLWFALDGRILPAEPECIRQVVMDALDAPNPPGMLNLGFRRLRGRRAVMEATCAYLQRPDVVRNIAGAGADWARRGWLTALGEMLSGATPSEAFGMSAQGRRPSSSFSNIDNIAVWVEHQVRQGRRPIDVLRQLHAAARHRSSGIPDERVIREKRAALRALSDEDVREMAQHAALAEGPPLTPVV